MANAQNDFWSGIAENGFEFDTADGQNFINTKLSSFLQIDELDVFESLKFCGLDEIAEKPGDQYSLCRATQNLGLGPKDHSIKMPLKFRKSNPLVISRKKESKIGESGPEKTVRKMISGFEYCLVQYKTKKDKLDLLHAAEKTHDGNTIIEVVLYLKNTFKKSVFKRELQAFPDALNVYLAYLEDNHKNHELAQMLLFAGRVEEAAVLKYKGALAIRNPEKKLQQIENCLSSNFEGISKDSLILQSVQEHKRILKAQVEFTKNDLDSIIAKTEMAHFEELTGKKSVIDSTVIDSLIYGCLYFYKSRKPSSVLTNPQNLVIDYYLSRKQFKWASLRALATLQQWSDVDDLFKSKDAQGFEQICPGFVACIEFPRILDILYKANAPTSVLSKYVTGVENDQQKLDLARKYGCHKIAFEIFQSYRDRLGLIKYKESYIDPFTPKLVTSDFMAFLDVLRNPMVRWKN